MNWVSLPRLGTGKPPLFVGGSDGISYGDLEIQKEPLWFTHPKPSSPMILSGDDEDCNGMEAWRKINKRYDPATGSRKGSLLRHILSPAKSKLEDLTGNLEIWLDLISRYENRKDPSGKRVKLQDEIKIAVLEQICPTELERHLQMSKARLKTFEDHREEIMSFLETRLGSEDFWVLIVYFTMFSLKLW